MKPKKVIPPNRIRQLRWELELTQAEVAEGTGIHVSIVSRHESQRRAISPKDAVLYRMFFGRGVLGHD